MPAVAQKPSISGDQVVRWMRENYAIEGRIEPLPGERDLNFKVETEGGERFVCKICGDLDELESLAAQNEVFALLNQGDLAAVPKIVESNHGVSLVPLTDGGRAYLGRVLTYVPGKILAECAPYNAALLRDLGRTVGRLDRALDGYDHPAFHHKFDWDLAHAMEVAARYRELVPDADVRAGVDRIHHDFADIVAPRCDQLRQGVIHNDANDYNILVEGSAVTGLIDFGDMVHSYTICDLAIAMAYAALGSDDHVEVIREMAGGYHEAMPIEDVELAVLFPMMRMRLAVSACMAGHQMRLRPDDPYLAISQEPIRRTLPKLLELDVKEVHQLLKESLA